MARCLPWKHEFRVVSETMSPSLRSSRQLFGLSTEPHDYGTYCEVTPDGGLEIWAMVCSRCGKKRRLAEKTQEEKK